MSDDQNERKGQLIVGLAIAGCFVVGIMGVALTFIVPNGISLIASAIAFGVLVHAFVR